MNACETPCRSHREDRVGARSATVAIHATRARTTRKRQYQQNRLTKIAKYTSTLSGRSCCERHRQQQQRHRKAHSTPDGAANFGHTRRSGHDQPKPQRPSTQSLIANYTTLSHASSLCTISLSAPSNRIDLLEKLPDLACIHTRCAILVESHKISGGACLEPRKARSGWPLRFAGCADFY